MPLEQQHTLPDFGLPPVVPPACDPPGTPRQCEECGHGEQINLAPCGEQLCECCYSERYVTCSACAAEVFVGDDFYSIGSESPYCRGCYMSAFAVCPCCSGEIVSGNMTDSPDGVRMCRSCYNSRFTTCCGCDRVIHFDNVAYVDEYDGDNYCGDCAPNNEDDDEAEWEQGRHVDGAKYESIGSQRRYGVELEISSCAKHAGLRGKTPFGVKYDGSLSSGKEFVSPILQGDEGLEAITNLCAYGKDNDWTVDSSCGYHVHVDCGDLDETKLRSVALGYALTGDVWARFVSKKRARNRYCGALPYGPEEGRNWTFQDFLRHTDDRYYWLNWQAYNRHKTVEIRLHSGTVNAEKVVNWVKIHARFVDAMAAMSAEDVWATFAGKTVEEKFKALMTLAGDSKLKRYYKRRAEKHQQPVMPVATPATDETVLAG